MFFKRKAYDKLLEWKHNYSDRYAVLLEGARRVGKSTIAENFAKNEYKSYILIDFSKITNNILECFDDIGNLNIFFLRLQAETGITLNMSLLLFLMKYSYFLKQDKQLNILLQMVDIVI